MSELFAVRVIEVSREAARLWVKSVHPDSGPPAPRAVFALMLLNDPIAKSEDAAFSKHRHLDGSALAEAMDQHSGFDSEWMNANAQAFVAKVTLSGPVLEIQPTHPAWIEHLRKGMAWETAAYDAGPGLPAAPRAPAKRGAPARRSQDPAAGFRVGQPKVAEHKLSDAFIALYGPNRYIADPVITDPDAMEKAVGTMLGQPLLVVPKRGPKRVGTLLLTKQRQALLYYETAELRGTEVVDFDYLKSLGRAWLTLDDAATASEPTAKPQSGGAKKAAKAGSAAKKAGSKGGAKKVAKVGSRAKKVAKKAAKAGSKVGAKKAAKRRS